MPSDAVPAGELINQRLEPIVLRALHRFRALLPREVELALELSHEDPWLRAHADRLENALLSACIVAWQSMVGLATQIVVEMTEVLLDDVVLDPDAEKLRGGLPPRRYARLVISNSSRAATGPFHTLVPAPAQTDDRPASARRLSLREVRDIMEQHQGMINVSPEPGRGTAFDIYLPAAVPLENTAGKEADAQAPHVVYVDDYEAMRVLVSDTLPQAGFRVTCHESAQQALAALRADAFDCEVLVTDYRLQTHTGIDLLKQVKLLRANLPVIVISGYLDSALEARAYEEGAAFVISKGDDLSSLCVALHRVLGHAPRPELVSYSDWARL
ncbi:response regulator [Polaromonas sp.]|uniref:response regulator n=1 Tax=Polaromonas sp. TaxID=1869339 RepID=UPI002488AA3B|nr:response regulator [Polaromonas sp.]MDI1272254.1 response regulator [Polaromonas sp.]